MINLTHDHTFSVRDRLGQSSSLTGVVSRQSEGQSHRSTLNRYSNPVLLEVEAEHFHHNSAVMMPDTVSGPEPGGTEASHFEDPSIMNSIKDSQPDTYNAFTVLPYDPSDDDGQDRVSGLGVLAAIYRFLELNTDYQLLLAGHCDTTGEPEYNFHLSELRARNVLYLLLGNRAPWVDICVNRSKVEDYQRILKHIVRTRAWDCDPGEIDGVNGEQTQHAVSAFQARYNSEFKRSISVDGNMGPQTWGAFYDLYMDELASMMGTDVAGLDNHRSQLRFVSASERFIACGEKMPIDQPQRQNYRSEENRRVEALFFRPPFLPDLSCHAGSRPYCQHDCSREECGVFGAGLFEFVYLDPSQLNGKFPDDAYQERFAISDNDSDLQQLSDRPDELYASEMETSDVPNGTDPEVAWAYMDPFAETDPTVGMGETTRTGGSALA